MNYRHQFHAGNFADVMKHLLLVQLVTAMQRKEKGFLYLDTHAGRGSYDLERASRGTTLEREPEWPAGIGRLWNAAELPAAVMGYVEQVRTFDRQRGNLEADPRFYPGSPALVQPLLRAQDRMVLCEREPGEAAALREEMARGFRCSVQEMDGYVALRAMLPPSEKRALVLIDPPFESPREFSDIAAALKQGLARLPAGVFAIWYPLTKRARVEAFFSELLQLELPPTAIAELAVEGIDSSLGMRGCGVVIVNPPWQFETGLASALNQLAALLAQGRGSSADFSWLVRER